MADRLAEERLAVLVLDCYTREGRAPDPGSPEKIMAAVAALPDPRVVGDIASACAHLREREDVDGDRVALTGLCIGGGFSILAAEDQPLRAVVAFYGQLRYHDRSDNKPRSPLEAADDLRCPLLGHYVDNDHLIPVDDVLELRERLRAREGETYNKPAEVYRYPGAGHAFHEHFRPEVYRPVAADEAWRRTITFLRWYLRDSG